MKKLLALFLALVMVVALLVPAVSAEEVQEDADAVAASPLGGETAAGGETVDFAFLATSDMHGQIYATDYTQPYEKSGTYKCGLTRVATYIKEMRAKYGNNLFVADAGDTIQGTPLTWYNAFFNKQADGDPAIKAFRTLGYDLWVVGNHEFNYGLDILNRQLDYATSASSGSEKQMATSMANYLDAAYNSDLSRMWDKTWKGYAPYLIKDFNGVKVAVIGLGNPNIHKWDPANHDGIYFAGIYDTYKHYEAEMKANADMIVVVTHCGLGSEASQATDSVRYLVENTDSIDFVFSGHEHGRNVTQITDKGGKTVNVLQPGDKAAMVSQVVVSYNKTTKEATIKAENVKLENYKLDDNLVALLKPYEEEVWEKYMNVKIGTAAGDFPAAGLGDAPSAFMDLINQVQLWGCYDKTGNTATTDDDKPAQLSISAPLTAGDKANLIPAGDIKQGDMFGLYRYENWFYQVKMSGKAVRTWLEFSATKLKVDKNGNPHATSLTYYDVIYGDGFSYTLDAGKPEGSRVTKMTYNGVDVTDDQEFTVVVNNYRFGGGGDYVNYLRTHGCDFPASRFDDAVIYSTQYDMDQGEDKGQARALLGAYIQEKGTITPEIKSTWNITRSHPELEGKTYILHTNDVHGQLMGYANIAALKKDLESKGAEVILVDAGDYSQGTIYVSLDKGENAIVMMNEAGYDLATLGNHEFDYGYEQLKANMAFFSGKILCANVLENGKPIFDGHTIIERNGVKIGFFGLETPEASTKANPALIKGLVFPAGKEMYAIAQQEVDALKAEGADIVICLAHLGVDSESEPNRSYDLYKNVTGIDFVIDGHSHTVMTEGENGEPIQSTGTKFENIGVIVVDKATKKIEKNYLEAIVWKDLGDKKISDRENDRPMDAAAQTLAAQLMDEIDEKFGVPFAKSEVDLNGAKDPGNRTMETNLGDLITDAMMWKILQDTSEVTVPKENILAITNGGGIRASIAKGEISMKDVNTVLPFGNTLSVVYVTGAELLEALEASTYSTPKAIGGFPQVSGLKFTIDVNKPYAKNDTTYPNSTYYGPKSINRVSIQEVNGKPFDPKATYAVITNNFLAAGGDTYYAFASASAQFDTGLPLDEVLMEYISEGLNGVVSAAQYEKTQGRITITKEAKPDSPKTGDNGIDIFMVTGLSSVVLLGAGLCVISRKKKEEN